MFLCVRTCCSCGLKMLFFLRLFWFSEFFISVSSIVVFHCVCCVDLYYSCLCLRLSWLGVFTAYFICMYQCLFNVFLFFCCFKMLPCYLYFWRLSFVLRGPKPTCNKFYTLHNLIQSNTISTYMYMYICIILSTRYV